MENSPGPHLAALQHQHQRHVDGAGAGGAQGLGQVDGAIAVALQVLQDLELPAEMVPPSYKLVYNPNNYRYNPLINPSSWTYKPT